LIDVAAMVVALAQWLACDARDAKQRSWLLLQS